VTPGLPAWSEPFHGPDRSALARTPALGRLGREVAFGRATGRGQLVAVVDSGVEVDHPAVGGRLRESVAVELRDGLPVVVDAGREGDVVGHGTACAGIIHSLAPEAELVSVGIAWAIEAGASVVNLSLSSRSEAQFAALHELADEAYFSNVLLVCAANNAPGPSYPSLFASVVSVAAHDVGDPAVWFHNPKPPVEFAAHGLDVDVAWRDGSWIVATGNSFAAPHIAGYATLIRAAHPDVMPFEVKTILAATADNAADTSG
jgi:subtilisin family serine protease